jgi:hypothetical protein
MPKKTGKRKSKKTKSQWTQHANPSPNLQTFSGPIVSKADKEEADLIVTTLNFTGVLTSTAGGVLDSSYSSDPASYALGDWTNLAATWHEYRVLGMRVEFFPNNRYSKAATVTTPMIVCVDRQSAGTLGSYQVAMDHASAKKVSLEDPWFKEVRMSNAEESQFISTVGTQALFWIKFYADGLSVSTQYGRAFVYLLLQFRGRK